MPTRDDLRVRGFSMLCAGILVVQVAALGCLPFELFEPWDKAFHVLAYGALTLLAWMATGGRRPSLVIAGVMAFCLANELRQSFIPARSADVTDFLAGALAAGTTGFLLFWKRHPKCAESSQP